MYQIIEVSFQIGIDGHAAAAMADALRQRILSFELDLAVLALVREEAKVIGGELDDWRVTGLEVLHCERVTL